MTPLDLRACAALEVSEMPVALLAAVALATVSPVAGGRHDRFAVVLTSARATGVFGQTRRSYVAEAHAVRPASGCVNNRDRVLAAHRASARGASTPCSIPRAARAA